MFAIGGRVALELPAPYSAARIEVDAITSWPVATTAATLAESWTNEPENERVAHYAVCMYLAEEGRPSWDLCDVRGPIPTDPDGLARLPLKLLLGIVTEWLGTYDTGTTDPVPAEPEPLAPETAVELVEP